MLIVLSIEENNLSSFLTAYKNLLNNPEDPTGYLNEIAPILNQVANVDIVKKNASRNREIWSKRKAGSTLASLGDEYGVSRERIRQICKHELEKEISCKRLADAISGKKDTKSPTFYDCLIEAGLRMNITKALISRACNCLTRCGIFCQMTEFGWDLDHYSDSYLLSLRGFGESTLFLCREANRLYKQYLNM